MKFVFFVIESMNYYFEADKLEPFFLKSAIFKAFINKVEYDSITNDVLIQ